MKTIQVSECYALHVHTRDAPATNQRNLRITSTFTFTGAKDPHDQRVVFDVTLSHDKYSELAAAIKETP